MGHKVGHDEARIVGMCVWSVLCMLWMVWNMLDEGVKGQSVQYTFKKHVQMTIEAMHARTAPSNNHQPSTVRVAGITQYSLLNRLLHRPRTYYSQLATCPRHVRFKVRVRSHVRETRRPSPKHSSRPSHRWSRLSQVSLSVRRFLPLFLGRDDT